VEALIEIIFPPLSVKNEKYFYIKRRANLKTRLEIYIACPRTDSP
jgi:hypothetical protein